MSVRKILLAFLASFVLAMPVYADQVVYQPGPVPGTDVWITNVYSYNSDYGVDDDKLQTGGFNDWYHFLIKFVLTGLPQTATSAELWMVPFSRGDSSTLVGMPIDLMTTDWNENAGWYNTVLNGTQVGTLPAPTLGYWYGITFTGIYNGWKAGTYPNYGFRFRASGNNNQFTQFRSSDYSYAPHRPKLVVTYDGANLRFPLKYNNWTPYTAQIIAVVDHSMTTGGGCADGVVVAYTGERGEAQYGHSSWSNPSENPSSCPNDTLYGFKNSARTSFSVNGQYNSPDPYGNNLFLFYDGHTGYDYPVQNGTDVHAAADGIAYYEGNALDVKIVHPSGYSTYYLHFSSRSVSNGQSVSKGTIIGQTGSGHLHFTVKKGTQRADPYGWKGEYGADPLKVDGKDNVCLWETCQWW